MHTQPLSGLRRPAAALTLGLAVVALGGCYATATHRVEIVAPFWRTRCEDAAKQVFARAGFEALSPPRNFTMFFAPRVRPAQPPRFSANTGVGILIAGEEGSASCKVTIEALSTDGSCPDDEPIECLHPGMPGGRPYDQSPTPICRTGPKTCEMTYAPGRDNDAMVDELARRLREELGPTARVN